MSRKVPRARETNWAQAAGRAERERPADKFEYPSEERARVEGVKSQSANPSGVSSEVPEAPARGPVAAFKDVRVLVSGDGYKVVDAPYRAGTPGRVRDAFDVMSDQAARAGSDVMFTEAQVYAGRQYAALTERIACAGVKCSSAFDVSKAGGGGLEFLEAYARDTARLSAFHEAIGGIIAKDMRRKPASEADRVVVTEDMLANTGRQIITARALVDGVCIKDQALSDVLRAHGWSVAGKNRDALRAALCAALNRMQGI